MPTWYSRIMTYAIARLKEPSTWRGMAVTLTAMGLALDPQQWQAITSVGLAIAGLIGVSLPDQPHPER